MSDFFERARSAGLIGFLLGALVLFGFGALFLAVFDDRLNGENATRLKETVREQAFEIYELEDLISDGEGRLLKQKHNQVIATSFENANATLELLTQKEMDLNAEIRSQNVALQKLEEGQVSYRDEYRKFIRKAAIGEVVEELQLKNGKKYQNVRIRDVYLDGVRFKTEFGTMSASWEEMSNEWSERFQIGRGEAEEAKAKLEAALAERDGGRSQTSLSRQDSLREIELKKALAKTTKSLAAKKKERNAAYLQAGALRGQIRQYHYDANRSSIHRKDQEMSARKASKTVTVLMAKISVMDNQIRDLETEKHRTEDDLRRLKYSRR